MLSTALAAEIELHLRAIVEGGGHGQVILNVQDNVVVHTEHKVGTQGKFQLFEETNHQNQGQFRIK